MKPTPLLTQYIQSVENAADCFKTLLPIAPIIENGKPKFASGGFAIVFKMQGGDKKNLAVKCFTSEQAERGRRFQKIQQFLKQNPMPFWIDFQYIESELWVNTTPQDGDEYDIVAMPWVEGRTLGEAVREACQRGDKSALRQLLTKFIDMALLLLALPCAHGDLKHDNIMVGNDGKLYLVDYDGFFVPDFKGEKSQERGSDDYQHPSRNTTTFDRHIDDFSIAIIALSLAALCERPELYAQYNQGQNLIFSRADFAQNTLSQAKIWGGLNLPKPITELLKYTEQQNSYKLPMLSGYLLQVSEQIGNDLQIWWDNLSNLEIFNAQPLPNDICIEIDDIDTGEKRLELWLQKNSLLPLRKTVTKTLNCNLAKKSDDSYIIKFYEGSSVLPPAAALNIGYMEITGKQVSRDIAKGSKVEITIEISESRDISISAYFNMSDQEFKNQFKPNARRKSPKFLTQEIIALSEQIDIELEQAEQNEEYETARVLQSLQKKIAELQTCAEALADDDVTDQFFQLDCQKRKVAQELYEATKNKRTAAAKQVYLETKTTCQKLVNEHGNDNERLAVQNIVSQEDAFFNSSNPQHIADKEDELNNIRLQILWRVPEFLLGIFSDLSRNHLTRMNDQQQATQLFEFGVQAIKQENWDRLRSIDQQLIQLLPIVVQQNFGKNSVGF